MHKPETQTSQTALSACQHGNGMAFATMLLHQPGTGLDVLSVLIKAVWVTPVRLYELFQPRSLLSRQSCIPSTGPCQAFTASMSDIPDEINLSSMTNSPNSPVSASALRTPIPSRSMKFCHARILPKNA